MRNLNYSTTKTVLLLQYCKLSRDENKSDEEWKGHLKIRLNECNYEMHARQSKVPFTSGINDEMMTAEIIKEITTMQKTSDIMSKQVLSWANRIGVQRTQTAMLPSIHENKELI